MDKNTKNTREVSHNVGFLKVNLSAISFFEKNYNNLNNLNESVGFSHKHLDKYNKGTGFCSGNSVLCNSSSCCVVFSLKLLSGTSNSNDYWNLCSEVITRPLFVKYKRNDRGFISFLINHTEALRFGNLNNLKSIKSVGKHNKHFDSVIDTDRFLLSIGLSIVKKSKLLYMGYGNKYLSSVDLFGKRLSVNIFGDKNNNSLNLDSGLLFFDLYAKRTHLVPISNPDSIILTDSVDTNHKSDNHNIQNIDADFDNNLNKLISTKKFDIEACLRDKNLLKECQLDDYTTSSSYVDSLSDLSSTKINQLNKKKKVSPPPKFKYDRVVSNEQVVHVHSSSTNSFENHNSTTSGTSKGAGEKNDEVHSEFCENFNAGSKYDKHINNTRVTYNKDFVELLDSLAYKKYANISQDSTSLLNVLNLESSRLKINESTVSRSKTDYLHSIAADSFSFKVFLKFVNFNGSNYKHKNYSDDVDVHEKQSSNEDNESQGVHNEHEPLDVILNELFLLSNKVFLIPNAKGTYDTVWIKTRSSTCLENIIKIPICTSGNKMSELFYYLSRINTSSVYGIGFLVDLKVDLFALEVFLSIFEDRIKNLRINVPISLTDVVFSLNFTEIPEYFNDSLDRLYSNRGRSSFATDTINTSNNSNSVHMDSHESHNSYPLVQNSDPKWTRVMKNEVDVIKNDNSLNDSFLKFIWPSYIKQFA